MTAQGKTGQVTKAYWFISGCNEVLAKTSSLQMFKCKYNLDGKVVSNDDTGS